MQVHSKFAILLGADRQPKGGRRIVEGPEEQLEPKISELERFGSPEPR
jgi:hypothetical protein